MPLNLQELKSHLWECAEILRGSAVDRADWKAYILPLLFFKRICDVWDEEAAEAAETYGDIQLTLFSEVHRFQVPEGYHRRDVRETPASVGTALAQAMREIERASPYTLYHVFGAAIYNDEWKMISRGVMDEICEALEVQPGDPSQPGVLRGMDQPFLSFRSIGPIQFPTAIMWAFAKSRITPRHRIMVS